MLDINSIVLGDSGYFSINAGSCTTAVQKSGLIFCMKFLALSKKLKQDSFFNK